MKTLKFAFYRYITLFLITIFIGLLSRKTVIIPAYIVDVLYALMSYWMFRFLFHKRKPILAYYLAILFCFTIELLQLIQTPFWQAIRANNYLKLVFGQGFLWSDLLAYCIGATLAFGIDIFLLNRKNKL